MTCRARKGVLNLYLLGGQSNATGFGSSSPNFTTSSNVTFYSTELTASNGLEFNIVDREKLRTVGFDRHGPELSLGPCLESQNPRSEKTVLVKYASNGTGIADWIPGGRVHNSFYEYLAEVKISLQSNFQKCRIVPRDLFWVQGERDANLNIEDSYVQGFATMVEELKAFYAFRPVFSLLQTNRGDGADKNASAAQINQNMIAAGYSTTGDNNDLPRVDAVHYSTDALNQLGLRLCNS